MVDPDKHMRFSGLVKKTHLLSTTVFVGFVAAHGGCTPVTCPPGYQGPFDNRDRWLFPGADFDWVCVPPPGPPPEAPDLSASPFSPRDTPGPRDRNAVAMSAVIVESCIHDILTPELNVNSRIDAIYSVSMKSGVERAIAKRTECLSSSENGQGCDRVRNCLGIAITPNDPRFAEGCTESIAMHRRVSPSGTIYNDWFNCRAMNGGTDNWSIYLECYSGATPRCDFPRKTCTSDTPPSCENDTPTTCEYSEEEDAFFTYKRPGCAKSATCVMEGDTPFCTGTGPACAETFATPEYAQVDFRSGIACEDATTLRTCVNGHEERIDCTKIGQTFTCIGGSRPHCGVDFQCGYDGQYPTPTCDGTKITVCNAGVPHTIDCRSLGFETCDPERGVCGNKPTTTQN